MSAPAWLKCDATAGTARIEIHLQPNARLTGVAGEHGQALKIRVAAPPTEQRANEMLRRFLAGNLQVAVGRIRILRGEKSRTKTVQIDHADAALLARIERLGTMSPAD
jgi:uncharacterized protein (TIGR00251 family)